MAIEIVDFPIRHVVISYSYVSHNQRVLIQWYKNYQDIFIMFHPNPKMNGPFNKASMDRDIWGPYGDHWELRTSLGETP